MIAPDISKINEAINLLIDIKNIFRQKIPTNPLDKKQSQSIKNYLMRLNNIINELNQDYGIKIHPEEVYKTKLATNFKKMLIIVNSPKNRKKLIDLGLAPTQLVATGGPINPLDISTLSPQISKSALENIGNKIKKFWQILESKIKKGGFSELLLLLGENNLADTILLKRKNDFEKKLSLHIRVITIPSFEKMDLSYLAFNDTLKK